MAQNFTSATVRTLAEWGKFFTKDGKANPIIELMNQDNSILDDVLWREANGYDGHTTTVRNGLPQVYWRRLYQGTPVSKSDVSMIKDPTAMLEGRNIIDVKLLEMHHSQANAYREGEARAFMESMRQKLATAIFYGNVGAQPDGIHGLDPRYAYKNSPQAIDAGGTGAECTSIFGIVWGENEVSGLFPRDSKAGLMHKPVPEFDAYDGSGNAFRAVGDLFTWDVGLTVRDWRCVVRICNIPMAALNKAKGDAGFVDLHRLTIKAKNCIPAEKRARLKWYMNQDVMTALEYQATDAGNVHLHYGEVFDSQPITYLHGGIVRQNDALLATETALGAM